jgi:hypothetical protein
MIYAKALVPLIITPALLLLELVGITPDMTVEQVLTFVVTLAVTALGVYLVPNKK